MHALSRSLLLAAAAAVVTACSAPSGDGAESASSKLSDSSPVALRYATLTGSGWTAVLEVQDNTFQERVSIAYQTATGAWTERPGTFLLGLGNGHEVWFVDQLPDLEPLHFAVHYRAIFSGGLANDFWDNDGGKNYAATRDSSAMGSGVDIAVTDASVRDGSLSTSILVRNRAFDKHVAIVFSTDGWKTTHTANARHDHGGGQAGEVWHVDVPLDPAATDVAFAAVVDQAGSEAWDNDFGRNFGCHLNPTNGWRCAGATLVSR